MAIGEPLFSGGSKLGKTTINWGLSSKPSLMTPEGNRIWQWYTKLWYRSFDPWIGVKKKNMLTPYKGLLRSYEWMGKRCLGASSVLFQLLRWQDPTQALRQFLVGIRSESHPLKYPRPMAFFWIDPIHVTRISIVTYDIGKGQIIVA
jgi:hypothetical protein